MKDRLKRTAKTVVDMIFETKLFNELMTRDMINEFENIMGDLLVFEYESYERVKKLVAKMDKLENKK